MTDAIQVALVTGAFTLTGIIFSRIWSLTEHRKTNEQLHRAEEQRDRVQKTVTAVADELRPNGGESTKDYVKRAMNAAERAVRGYDTLDERINDLRREFARYIIHEGRNDLNVSALLKEEEEYLKKLDEEQRAKRRRDEIEGEQGTTFD